MAQHRTNAILKLIKELEEFEIELNPYYDTPELQGVIDDILTGKLDTLACFCQAFGWGHLVGILRDTIPIERDAVQILEKLHGYILPEIRHLLETEDIEQTPSPTEWFWELIHPRIKALAKPRFEAGHHGDAVESSFKELNTVIKRIHKDETGNELDGAGLMTTAFSIQNPTIKLSELESETDKNIQKGYMQIMAGSMIGIRNPKAHSNLNPDSQRTLHLICLASLLMCKVDDRI